MKLKNSALYPSKLTIDLSAVADNYTEIKKRVSQDCEVAACVKADAYGLGVEPVATKLYRAGCRIFYVATPQEGAQLRDILTDKTVRIGVLNGLFIGSEDHYYEFDLTPVLNSLEEITRWQKFASQKGLILDAMIQFDIGMNRLGLDYYDSFDFMQDVDRYTKKLKVTHVLGHLSRSDDQYDGGMTGEQVHRFLTVKERVERAGLNQTKFSISNSGGIFREHYFNSVRPGIILYGGQLPLSGGNIIKPVVSLTTRLLQIRKACSGDTVGYGATRVFRSEKILGTVSYGYADGFLRSNSNKSNFYWKGFQLPVVGRVSMDLVTLDMTNIPIDEHPRVGQDIEILGIHQKIDDLAKTAGTISYEILTSLGKRSDRVYIQ